jgi:hypothetical protein
MTYRGRVKNGVVVLDGPGALPEGAVVSIRTVAGAGRVAKARKQAPTMYDRYKRCIGKAKGMPADASVNIDHYLYGAPKHK